MCHSVRSPGNNAVKKLRAPLSIRVLCIPLYVICSRVVGPYGTPAAGKRRSQCKLTRTDKGPGVMIVPGAAVAADDDPYIAIEVGLVKVLHGAVTRAGAPWSSRQTTAR